MKYMLQAAFTGVALWMSAEYFWHPRRPGMVEAAVKWWLALLG